MYECEQCSFVFPRVGSLKKHIVANHVEIDLLTTSLEMGSKITLNKAKDFKIINPKKGSANVTPDINTEEFDWISLDNIEDIMEYKELTRDNSNINLGAKTLDEKPLEEDLLLNAEKNTDQVKVELSEEIEMVHDSKDSILSEQMFQISENLGRSYNFKL